MPPFFNYVHPLRTEVGGDPRRNAEPLEKITMRDITLVYRGVKYTVKR